MNFGRWHIILAICYEIETRHIADYRGVPQAHGALFLYKNHEANVLKLAKEYGAEIRRTTGSRDGSFSKQERVGEWTLYECLLTFLIILDIFS